MWLKQTERDVEEIEQWIRHQDVTSLMQQTTAFSQKFDRFERDLDNIAVDEALMAYSGTVLYKDQQCKFL